MPDAAADQAPDPLRAAALDLERLQALLHDACATLLSRFAGAAVLLRADRPDAGAALRQLDAAVVALQFEDMAQQLIAHTRSVLADCAPSNHAPSRDAARCPPVLQAGVEPGGIDLF